MEDDAVNDYNQTLASLTTNNKQQINLLTILADDYRQSAPEIVKSIEKHVYKLAKEQKLSAVYLADSILKNVGSPYRELFAKSIIKIFLHVFENGDEKVRASMYKLRQTWQGIFLAGKLYELDLEVQKIDSAWPLLTPHSRGPPVVANSARVLPVPATHPPPLQASASTSSLSNPAHSVHVNPKFMKVAPSGTQQIGPKATQIAQADPRMRPQKAEADIKKEADVGTPEKRTALLQAPAGLRAKASSEQTLPIPERFVKMEPMDTMDSTHDMPRGEEVKHEIVDSGSPIGNSGRDRSKNTYSKPPTIRDENISSDDRLRRRREPESQRIRDKDERIDRRRANDVDQGPPSKHRRPNEMTAQRQGRQFMQPTSSRGWASQRSPNRSRKGVLQQTKRTAKPMPTNAPGAHAFAIPPRQISPPLSSVPPIYPIPATSPGRSPLLDGAYQAPFATRPLEGHRISPPLPHRPPSAGLLPPPMAPVAPTMGGPPHMPPALPPGLVFPPNYTPSATVAAAAAAAGQYLTTTASSSGPFPYDGRGVPTMPPPAVPPQQHVITDDAVKLEGIPANNRIFVDGRAHEVLYIGDIAVIERNGLPHRIYFMGQPRNVVIDGRPYMLAFGEVKEVMIDGCPHQLRFGAPSRELYMGDYPFKGSFGGPLIRATINGKPHEIRLSGPAPEVKIDPDPSYDLARFLPKARAGLQERSKPEPPAPPPAAKANDINELLAKLKQGGILDMIKKKGQGPERAPPPVQEPPPPPPIPSEVRGTGTDRLPAPHPNFKKNPFDMRYLRIRYTNIVTALHEVRSSCPQCGLRLAQDSGERYERHLDWHVRKNLSATTATAARSWYGSAKEWIHRIEVGDDEDNEPGSSKAKVAEAPEEPPSLASNEIESKMCSVCAEEFDEYYDEDADAWKMRNCVRVGKTTCHVACAQDAARQQEEEEVIEIDEKKPILNSIKDEKKPILSTSDPRLAAHSQVPTDPRLARLAVAKSQSPVI